MSIQRFHAPYVVTQDADGRVLAPGMVEVTDGWITWVGEPDQAPPPDEHGPAVSVRHLDGVLLPGLVNTHAHSPMTLLRGAGEGLPVDRWLTEVMWPREARLTAEDVAWGMRLGAAQLLRGGITTTVEMYFHPEALARAGREVGLRTVVTPPVLVAPGLEHHGSWQQQLEHALELAEVFRDDPLVDVGLGPHSAYAVPTEPLVATIDAAVAHGLLLHVHVAEGEHEGDAITAEHGVSVPRYLERLGALGTRLLAAHGVWLTDDDIALLADHRAGVAHCPASNAKHASGLAPVRALRAAGVPVGIATDGPASHDRLDAFEEARTAIRLARLREGDAGALGPHEALRMLTREAADALGRDDLGALQAGRRADLVHLGLRPDIGPLLTARDLPTHLVWSGSPAAVRDVWVGGRAVVADHRLVGVDLDLAYDQVVRRAGRLARR